MNTNELNKSLNMKWIREHCFLFSANRTHSTFWNSNAEKANRKHRFSAAVWVKRWSHWQMRSLNQFVAQQKKQQSRNSRNDIRELLSIGWVFEWIWLVLNLLCRRRIFVPMKTSSIIRNTRNLGSVLLMDLKPKQIIHYYLEIEILSKTSEVNLRFLRKTLNSLSSPFPFLTNYPCNFDLEIATLIS